MSTKIIKSWFYKLSEFEDKNIKVEDNISAIFFDDLNFLPFPKGILVRWGGISFSLWENSKVEIFWVLQNTSNYELNIISNKQSSSLKVRYILLSWNWEKTIAKIKSSIESSHTKADIKIISLVMDNWFIDLDAVIDIKSSIEKVKWHLFEENIFLWSTGKIKWIPTLLVASDDVEASHACKIEKISDEELFYLRSRGVWKDDAISMMIEAKISDLFKCLSMVDKDFYDNLIKNILIKIK